MAGALSHFSSKPSLLSLSRSNPNRPSSSYKPMIVTMAHNQSYWASIDADIEVHLKNAIPIRPPLSVFEPMHYLAFAAPRTTAPALCIAACELVGGHRDQAMAAASALHLMHAAAYTHEHLPLTDRPRPKPTVHHAYSPNIELLTGDGIFPFGYELLARHNDVAKNSSDRILRVIIEITRAMGSQGVVDGQYREVQCNQSDGEEPCHVGWIDYVCKKKEGELHACGAACGAILGGGSEEEIERLRKYGLYVGMIQGMVHGVGKNEKESKEVVEGLRELAMKELENFSDRKVESISSLVEANLCNV
nr:GPPS [Cornus officinalis]